jgi:hypothetical protein
MYLAVKNHFTQPKYDYFKYNGKMNISRDAFLARRDKMIFEILSKKVSAEDMLDLFVSNMLADNTYAISFIHEEGKETLKKYQSKMQSLTYNFTSDLENALITVGGVKKLFKPGSNGYPEIMNLYMQQVVSLQTLVILDYYIQFLSRYETRLEGDYIWDKFLLKVRKYAPFILRSLDKKKFGDIIKSKAEAYK